MCWFPALRMEAASPLRSGMCCPACAVHRQAGGGRGPAHPLLLHRDFPDNFRHKVPLIFPNQILFGLVPVLCAGKLAAVTPSEKQLEQSQKKWGGYGLEVKSYAASPYGEMEAVEAAAGRLPKLMPTWFFWTALATPLK